MNKISNQGIKFSRLFFRDATVVLALVLFVGALALGDSPMSLQLSYLAVGSSAVSVMLQAWVVLKPRRR